MKKKVLSLLMAAAVVATTAVPAHATSQTVGGDDTQVYDANVTVTGTVTNADGIAPTGKIQVEVPTALSFTVDKAGNFQTASTYTIANKSAEAVSVSVGSFKETNENGGIILHNEGTTMTDLDRSNVILTLKGKDGQVDLSNVDTDVVISTIESNNTDNIQLIGEAGKNVSSGAAVDTDGASEEFNLVFKIKKA